jgi:hypothetical protein
MPTHVKRLTVDLAEYPDLVVIYLGMRVNRIAGIKTLMGFGPRISRSVGDHPEGLLLHENFIFSFFPMHAGMRQYWRDQESLLKWTRSDPHREWWRNFLADSGGTGFWHETYLRRGGMEAISDDIVPQLRVLECSLRDPRWFPKRTCTNLRTNSCLASCAFQLRKSKHRAVAAERFLQQFLAAPAACWVRPVGESKTKQSSPRL